MLKHLDETLANDSGSAKYSDCNLLLWHFLWGKIKLYHVRLSGEGMRELPVFSGGGQSQCSRDFTRNLPGSLVARADGQFGQAVERQALLIKPA